MPCMFSNHNTTLVRHPTQPLHKRPKICTYFGELFFFFLFSSISPDESLLIITPIKKEKPKLRTPAPPSGVVDFDKENIADPCQVSVYAMDVFKYLKTREVDFIVGDYMPRQVTFFSTLFFVGFSIRDKWRKWNFKKTKLKVSRFPFLSIF